MGEASEGRIGQGAGCYQHKTAMELRSPAPVDGECEGDREADYIHDLDDEEGRCRKAAVGVDEGSFVERLNSDG